MALTPGAYHTVFILYANVWKGVFSILVSERDTRIWEAEKMTAVRLHCFIAKEHLGPLLIPGAVGCHVNGDRGVNWPENLRVLPSQGHHVTLEQLPWKVERGIEPLFGFDELPK